MRITSFITAAAFVVSLPVAAFGNCVNTPTSNGALSPTQIANLLGSKTACVAAGGGGWENQEYHNGTNSGTIVDFKKGAAAPGKVDPTLTIGSYTVGSTVILVGSTPTTVGQVTYSYYGGGNFTYFVLGASQSTSPRPGTFFFCTAIGGTPITVKIEATAGGCV